MKNEDKKPELNRVLRRELLNLEQATSIAVGHAEILKVDDLPAGVDAEEFEEMRQELYDRAELTRDQFHDIVVNLFGLDTLNSIQNEAYSEQFEQYKVA